MDNNFLLCQKINQKVSLKGKRILEIGCGNGDLLRAISNLYNPEHIIGIDLMLDSWWGLKENSGENWEVRDGNAENLKFDDSSFDVVITISTFEHIHNTDKALSEIQRVLKPHGQMYANFSPIWTSIIGHHFVATDDNTWNPMHLSLIPPWGHLYMDEFQMGSHLNSLHTDEKLKNEILYFIYKHNIINRKTKTELANSFFNSGMVVIYYAENVRFSRDMIQYKNELTSEIKNNIINMGYDVNDIGISGIEILLKKL
jgi:ubiquinone/menaquinone biosynthesis C-methylase UbiE